MLADDRRVADFPFGLDPLEICRSTRCVGLAGVDKTGERTEEYSLRPRYLLPLPAT